MCVPDNVTLVKPQTIGRWTVSPVSQELQLQSVKGAREKRTEVKRGWKSDVYIRQTPDAAEVTLDLTEARDIVGIADTLNILECRLDCFDYRNVYYLVKTIIWTLQQNSLLMPGLAGY